jgi:hypothetical protein
MPYGYQDPSGITRRGGASFFGPGYGGPTSLGGLFRPQAQGGSQGGWDDGQGNRGGSWTGENSGGGWGEGPGPYQRPKPPQQGGYPGTATNPGPPGDTHGGGSGGYEGYGGGGGWSGNDPRSDMNARYQTRGSAWEWINGSPLFGSQDPYPAPPPYAPPQGGAPPQGQPPYQPPGGYRPPATQPGYQPPPYPQGSRR